VTDILHDFVIKAPRAQVFQAIATPEGLDRWWTLRSSGRAELGATWELYFGEPHDWRAVVTRCRPGEAFELGLTRADAEWSGTSVRFTLAEHDDLTALRFAHVGWPSSSAHCRTSSYCWAMYLRLLRRWLELGETVPYALRLDA
jgi:uncharacterized protein YndB with AHSA1/START domain